MVASSIRVVKTWEELAAARAAWVDLVERSGALPTASPEWVLPGWRAFGSGRLCSVMVDDPVDTGRLLGLGLFIESRAPGPRLVRSVVASTGAVAEILVDPDHPDLAREIVVAALGSSPALFRCSAFLGGEGLRGATLDDVAGAGGAGRATVVLRPNDAGTTLWELTVDALESGLSGVAEAARDAGLEVRLGRDVDVDEKAFRHLDHVFHGPEPVDGADRRAAFVPEVLDGFARHGRLVWPIVTRGEEIVATSAWLVSGHRAMLWLRWELDPVDGPGVDVVAAIEPLRRAGVTSMAVSDRLVLPAFAAVTRRVPDLVEVTNRSWLGAAGRLCSRSAARRRR